MTAVPETVAYFDALVGYGRDLLDRLPVPLEPEPLAYTLDRLKPAVDAAREAEVAHVAAVERPVPADENGSRSAGLNTIGMLADRLTILIVKEWSLRHKGTPKPDKADELARTQTNEIVRALAEAVPGYSSVNSKITRLSAEAEAPTWAAAFYGLLTTNLLLWESQEVLYVKDISVLPAEELRGYITWFAWGNILRNEYIQACEERYWNDVPAGQTAGQTGSGTPHSETLSA